MKAKKLNYTPKQIQAYQIGLKDRENGKPRSDNPFIAAELREAWDYGWIIAHGLLLP